MRLIVDSNRIIAGLIRASATRKIILHPHLEFFAPDHLLVEINNHRELIVKKSKLSSDDLKIVLEMLLERINIVPKAETDKKKQEAKKIIGDVDPDDVPFIALALTIPNDGVWTEDKHFISQRTIKVWSTADLLQFLGL